MRRKLKNPELKGWYVVHEGNRFTGKHRWWVHHSIRIAPGYGSIPPKDFTPEQRGPFATQEEAIEVYQELAGWDQLGKTQPTAVLIGKATIPDPPTGVLTVPKIEFPPPDTADPGY